MRRENEVEPGELSKEREIRACQPASRRVQGGLRYKGVGEPKTCFVGEEEGEAAEFFNWTILERENRSLKIASPLSQT